MYDIRKYDVFYKVVKPDGEVDVDVVSFTCFSCLSAISRFEEYLFYDVDGLFIDCEVEIISVRKV